MSIGSRIKEARSRVGITQEQLASMLNVSKGAVGNYENDTNYPKTEIVFELCRILKCDANYLYQDDVKGMAEFRVAFTEQKLIKKYRYLDEHGRDVIDTLLEKEYKRCRMEQESKSAALSKIELRRYISPAAAGTPLYAEWDYEKVDYPSEVVPEGTEYAVGISGRSMEPDVPDGCSAFVERTDQIRNGDIVIAWVEGEGTVCKQAVMNIDQIVRLRSINRQFPDITGEELKGLRIYGKVLGVYQG